MEKTRFYEFSPFLYLFQLIEILVPLGSETWIILLEDTDPITRTVWCMTVVQRVK